MRSNYLQKIIVLTVIITSIAYSSSSLATVIMMGNRVIYSADSKEKMLQFSNPDNIPYIIQVWTDINNPNSKPETADGPFIATPQLFKIEPKQGQAVRLMFNNKLSLPTDRESIFYFNFLQLPGLNAEQKDQNKLVLLVTSRLKIFYRPKNLGIAPQNISEKIQFRLNNNQLEATNNSPYYATFDKIELLGNNQQIIATIKDPDMLAPMSKYTWTIKDNQMSKAITIKYSIINDFGVAVDHEFHL